MKKIKKLNGAVQNYNGVVTRFKKDPSKENQGLLDEALARLKQEGFRDEAVLEREPAHRCCMAVVSSCREMLG